MRKRALASVTVRSPPSVSWGTFAISWRSRSRSNLPIARPRGVDLAPHARGLVHQRSARAHETDGFELAHRVSQVGSQGRDDVEVRRRDDLESSGRREIDESNVHRCRKPGILGVVVGPDLGRTLEGGSSRGIAIDGMRRPEENVDLASIRRPTRRARAEILQGIGEPPRVLLAGFVRRRFRSGIPTLPEGLDESQLLRGIAQGIEARALLARDDPFHVLVDPPIEELVDSRDVLVGDEAERVAGSEGDRSGLDAKSDAGFLVAVDLSRAGFGGAAGLARAVDFEDRSALVDARALDNEELEGYVLRHLEEDDLPVARAAKAGRGRPVYLKRGES